MAEVAALHRPGQRAGSAAERAARPPRLARAAQQVVTQVNGDVQKAGAAMKAEDYAGAQKPVDGRSKERLQKVDASASPRRRRARKLRDAGK